MKNKLITIFAIVGAFATVAGIIAYILNCKRQFDGINEGD